MDRTTKLILHFIFFLSGYLDATLTMAQPELMRPVVCITAEKEVSEMETGAGIIVGQKDNVLYILTAYHVVMEMVDKTPVEAKNIQVHLYKEAGSLKASIARKDLQLDVAVLTVIIAKKYLLEELIPADKSAMKEKKKVVSIGHPKGCDWTPNYLNVIQEVSIYADERVFSITPQAVVGGCSGGPVFLENGAWLGMVTETGGVEAKGVKAEAMTNWLQGLGVLTNFIYYPKPEMVPILGGLFLGKNEVTVKEFRAFVVASGYVTDAEKKGYTISLALSKDLDFEGKYILSEVSGTNWRHDVFGKLIEPKNWNFPVVHISWNDAMAYCNWISQKTGEKYNLPHVAEWNYAFNAFSQIKDHWFENICDAKLLEITAIMDSDGTVHNDGFLTLAPIRSFQQNKLGLYDMYGNVSEWSRDTFIKGNEYQYVFTGPNWLFYCLSSYNKLIYIDIVQVFPDGKKEYDYTGADVVSYKSTESNCFLGFRLAKDKASPENLKVLEQIKKTVTLDPEEDYVTVENAKTQISNREKAVAKIETLKKNYPQNKLIPYYLAISLGNLAWSYLFANRFKDAEISARKGLQTDPLQEWIKTNLALALLYQGRLMEAKVIYQEMMNRPDYSKAFYRTYKKIFLDDLDYLTVHGVIHPDVEKIRKLLWD